VKGERFMRRKHGFLLMMALYATLSGGSFAADIEGPEPEITDDAFL